MKSEHLLKILYEIIVNKKVVSYEYIINTFKVDRKTAERYIKCLCCNFGKNVIVEKQPPKQKQKLWGI